MLSSVQGHVTSSAITFLVILNNHHVHRVYLHELKYAAANFSASRFLNEVKPLIVVTAKCKHNISSGIFFSKNKTGTLAVIAALPPTSPNLGLCTLRKKVLEWFFRMVNGSTWNLLLSELG